MAKSKARKSLHSKAKTALAARNAVIEPQPKAKKASKKKVARADSGDKENDEVFERAPENFDENISWDIEGFGGLYLVWGKRRQRDADGSVKLKYYLKPDTEHRIWVKWTVAFNDGIRWSAEKQEMLDKNCKGKIKEILAAKEAWPLPSASEGLKSGWKERRAICMAAGISEWKPVVHEGTWQVIDPELPVTQSEIDDTDEETDDEDSSS